jgi:formylglycine-generating enzyme required for sulfatase activity
VEKSVTPPPTITNSIGITLRLIPAGKFLMGSTKVFDPHARDDEMVDGLPHRVRITRPFYLGETEVTQGQYKSVTGKNPSVFKGEADLPVENVTWFEAVGFCNVLSIQEGLPPFYRVDGQRVAVVDWQGCGYRLPTEAEWEYACRAGSNTLFSFGSDPAGLDEHAWSKGNSGGKTHPVGQKHRNAFGLFDMHGNVQEWCWDRGRYPNDGKDYAESPRDDPVLKETSRPSRVIRGGEWSSSPYQLRSAIRGGDNEGLAYNYLGFRVARGTGPTSGSPTRIPSSSLHPLQHELIPNEELKAAGDGAPK